ncbi:MAG: CRISPR-associated protein Cas5 [Thermaerobacter sp.]|nr:CRISPR-associated protein Cas5 [Thermaerobacter sp.]
MTGSPEVLRVQLAAYTASFRYAHFLTGQQPTYPLPPPTTIYGLLAAALGEYPPPGELAFAYRFDAQGTGWDLEHLHIAQPGGVKDFPHPPNLKAIVTPTLREFFLQPRLTLYLRAPALDRWVDTFRAPRYALSLGRSQDLATVRSVDVFVPPRRTAVYWAGSLLPAERESEAPGGILLTLPTWLDPTDRRISRFGRFVALVRPQSAVAAQEVEVDPGQPSFQGRPWGLIWHHFDA